MNRSESNPTSTMRPMSRSDLQKLSHRLSIADRCEQEEHSKKHPIDQGDIRELSMVLEASEDVNDVINFYGR